MKCSRCQQQLDPDVNRTCIPNTMNILDADLTGFAVFINFSFLTAFFCDLDTSAPLNRFCRDLLGGGGRLSRGSSGKQDGGRGGGGGVIRKSECGSLCVM